VGKVQIDRLGAIYLLVAMLVTKMFTAQPQMLAQKVGTSTWLVVLLAGVVGLVGYLLLYALLRRFPERSLGHITRQVLGRPVGSLFCLLYSFYFIYVVGLFLRQFEAGFKIAVLPQTPPAGLMLVLVLPVLFAAYKGMEDLARMAAYLFPLLLLMLLLLLAGTFRLLDFRQLMPLFGNGVSTTLLMPFPLSSLFSEILTIGVMAGMLRAKDLNRVGMGAMLGSIGLLTLITVIMHAAFPIPAVARLSYPLLELARAVQIGEFLTRVESLFVFLWFFIAALKLAAGLVSGAIFFSEMAGIADYRPLIFPLGMIAYVIAFLPTDTLTTTWLDSETIRMWTWLFSFGLPTITLGVAILRGKRGGPDAPLPSGSD
jgi:spore germination protein KB